MSKKSFISAVLIMGLFLAGTTAIAQSPTAKEQRRLMKQLKKEEQAKELARTTELMSVMLEQRKFVLEADQLRDGYGNLAQVPSTLNFIAADSTRGVIQVGNNSTMGLNGVGGITLDGQLKNYEMKYNEKRGTHIVSYDVMSGLGTYHLAMTVYPDGRADATLSSNWRGRLTYMGRLVPPGASRVFQGRSY